MFPSRTLLRRSLALAWPAAACLGVLLACDTPRMLAVRVSIPGPDTVETPVTGVGLVALPYDRDSVLHQLEQRARAPRPPTAPLERLFAGFRGPFAAYSGAAYRLAKLRDSLGAARGALDTLSRESPAYGQSSALLGRLTDSLHAAEQRSERARGELDRARRALVVGGDSLRLRMRQWEDSTYLGYDSLVQALARRAGHEPITDTTGADGWAALTLAPGRWWVYARSWDATDPNAEWYWNVPVDSDTMLLSSRTARRQPRY